MAVDDNVVMEIRRLSKSFGKILAVDDATFVLRRGEVHGFIGPNGAGKTTTMRIMAGVEQPDAGDVLMNGVSVVDRPDACRPDIGFMPDYLDSYPRILVREYLDFYSRLYGRRPAMRRARTADVVEFTGLGGVIGQTVESLSKGWKQRLSLARVLLNDPTVLILDEPAAGLDPRARIELRDLVALLARNGKAVFISSHILAELAEMCQSVTIIENGRLCASAGMGDLRRGVDKGHRMSVLLLDPDQAEVDRLCRFLSETPGVAEALPRADGASFTYDGDAPFRAALLSGLIGGGFRITDFHSSTSSLEEAFIVMTGGRRQGG